MIPVPSVFVGGVVLFLLVAWDAFEAIILPRRVTRKFRLTRLYYRSTWTIWKALARAISSTKRREAFLGFYGPISLLFLIGVWAIGLVLSFGMLQYGAGSAVNVTGQSTSLYMDLYLSGTTFFTLGLGDVVPRSSLARLLVVAEAGFGFGFLAAVIGYLPFIYGAFAEREVDISLLDSRAGTPPTAGELLRRHSFPNGHESLRILLKDWELWCAQLMESHLSYPVLAYFRSQHDNQSWIASLTAILDTCALTIASIDQACAKQAELTFAIARHAVVDLSQVFSATPRALPQDRLPAEELLRLRSKLMQHGLNLRATPEADGKLMELRSMYEPYVFALANHLSQSLPPWIPVKKGKDNWQTTAWGQTAGMLTSESEHAFHDDHF
jgi:hypothetical protein